MVLCPKCYMVFGNEIILSEHMASVHNLRRYDAEDDGNEESEKSYESEKEYTKAELRTILR